MSQVAHPVSPPILAGFRSRRLLWSLLGLVAVASVTVVLVLAINPGDKNSRTASAPVKQAATYPGRPSQGLGTLPSQPSGYSARPDEGVAPIAKQSAPTGYSARPDEGVAPIQLSGGR
jgi:hypothetical protein